MRQVGNTVGVTVSTAVFSTVGSKIGRGEDMLPCYRAAQWTSSAFGLVALALGVICFRGVGVPGHCTPQPASISGIEKGECLDERIPSPENTHVAQSSEEKKNDNCDHNWKT
jgi:hypothetical protein